MLIIIIIIIVQTFDPKFTPNLSTNLKKFKAVSEVSVFDVLCLPNQHHPKTDYITLEQLGIHVHVNNYTRPSHLDSSSDPCVTELAEGECNTRRLSSQTVACYPTDTNSLNGSTFSLTIDMLQTNSDTQGIFCNTHVDSAEDEREGRGSLSSDNLDFVEDGLRIDIEGLSDEESGAYFVVENSLTNDENDPTVSFQIASNEDYFNVQDATNVRATDISSSYLSSEHIEHYQQRNQITTHASLPSLILPSERSLLSPLSTSVPSVCV